MKLQNLLTCRDKAESHLGFYSAFPDIGNYFPDIGNWNSRYREINFRYREMIDFPISGNDFRISEIDFPISGNVLDFPISGNQFPISENRHPTEAGHSATLQHRPTTPPPINNGPQLYQSHLLVDLYGPTYTTSVNRSVQPTIIIQPMISLKMPFKNRDNNYDKTYQSHRTWKPLK